jgi:hypothetical protein
MDKVQKHNSFKPPYLPDLSPPDFFLFFQIKNDHYRKKISNSRGHNYKYNK